MRNLRLYNTTGAFEQDELAANNDNLNTVVAVVPGVSRTKDSRKTHFNPKDKEMAYKTITCRHISSGITISSDTPVDIKYFSGTTPEVFLTSDKTGLGGYICTTNYQKINLPTDLTTAITFQYVYRPEGMVSCEYELENSGSTSLVNTTSYLLAMKVDGNEVSKRSSHTFNTPGIHKVDFAFIGGTLSYTFQNVKNLKSIVIPSHITQLGTSAFRSDTKLENVTLSDNIVNLPASSFASCSSIERIVIPASVIVVSNSCFCDCTNLKEIVCLAKTAPTISSQTFKNVGQNGKLYYPSGSDYSSWLSQAENCLGYYGWTGEEIN